MYPKQQNILAMYVNNVYQQPTMYTKNVGKPRIHANKAHQQNIFYK